MSFWEQMLSYGTLVVLIGTSLLGACGGMVGTFAVLRRRSLTGDALAHAALPGICLGYLLTGERNVLLILLGALFTGLLGTQIISFLTRYTRIKEDASIGIVLSVFFGLGVVLLKIVEKLPGGGTSQGLTTYALGSAAGIREADVYLIGAGSLACLMVLLFLYKEFKLVAFDQEYAQAQGWPSLRLDMVLMGLIAVTVVIGLRTVGALMVAALLIIPSASARFWTNRLGWMLFLSAIFGWIMGMGGTGLSAGTNVPTGPIIVLVGSIIFVLSVLISPQRGALARLVAKWRFRQDLQQRGLLRALYDLSEAALPERPRLTLSEIRRHGAWSERLLSPMLARAIQGRQVIREEDDHFQLTEEGLERAAEVARAERLWELFVNEHAELASSIVNWASDRPEDVLPAELMEELSAKLEQQGRLPRGASYEVGQQP